MSPRERKQPEGPEEVFAEAYRAYLNAVREGLANVDIEAIDIGREGGPAGALLTFYTYHTWYTWHTYYTYHTWYTLQCTHSINTVNTLNTVSTESSLAQQG